jgi:hypothetical protein
MNSTGEKRTVTITGVILTIAVTLGLIWSVLQLLDPGIDTPEPTALQKRENEITVYENLKKIAAAQTYYRQKDYDRDGEEEFAMFYVHLYTSVSPESHPIPVNLIPKQLAFAMGISRALDGYYFKDLRQQELAGGKRESFDYTRQWAVLAAPASKGRTGVLTLIAHHNGAVYVTPKMHTELLVPYEPERNGWAKIDSLAQLKQFQKHVTY